ncbi:hypothetical protein LJR044_002472 [Microbacterium foliorum]
MNLGKSFVIGAAIIVVVLFGLAVLFASTDWRDTVPAWLGGIGGMLGGFAALYALSVAIRTAEEHVTWSKVITGHGKKGTPNKFEFVNVSKATVARITDVSDITGDPIPALDFAISLPVDVAPGASVPASVSRSFANSAPTAVKITWVERSITAERAGKREYTQTVWL